MKKQQLLSEMMRLGPWFHSIRLAKGVITKWPKMHHVVDWDSRYPVDLWRVIRPWIPKDLKGKTVLDVGCSAGFFSFKLAGRGASVYGIDSNQGPFFTRNIEQAQFCNDILNAGVIFEERDFFNVKGKYDILLFLGIYYHLERYQEALSQLFSLLKPNGLLLFETAINPTQCKLYTPEDPYHGDITNVFVPTREYILEQLTLNGFAVLEEKRYMLEDRMLLRCQQRGKTWPDK